MPWWAWLLSVAFIVLLLGLALQLMKLRIFGRYLRENKTDQLRLQLKLGFLALCYEQGEDEKGEKRGRIYPLIGRLLPPGFLQRELPPRKEPQGEDWWKSLLNRDGRFRMQQTIGRVRPLLKEITWSHFELELSWGWSDPAWTGLAAGGVWAAGGVITGLLYQYFSVAARPRVKVLPFWNPAEPQLFWEGELSLSLYSCLKFLRAIKKTGGINDGASSY